MTASIAATPSSVTAPVSAGAGRHSTDEDFTFSDLVSIVNPLQHIPVVATVYRAVTGETIKPFERIAGDTLYGGLWGFASGVFNVVFEEATGKDLGATVLSMIDGDDDNASSATASRCSLSPGAASDRK